MEISVLILSCVILGLNPVLPVLLYLIFLISRFVTLYGFYQIKYIHTYIHTPYNSVSVAIDASEGVHQGSAVVEMVVQNIEVVH